jgi:hypothetical protein
VIAGAGNIPAEKPQRDRIDLSFRRPIMIPRPHRRVALAGVLAPALLLTACAQPPMGPTVQVLPGQGKSFE